MCTSPSGNPQWGGGLVGGRWSRGETNGCSFTLTNRKTTGWPAAAATGRRCALFRGRTVVATGTGISECWRACGPVEHIAEFSLVTTLLLRGPQPTSTRSLSLSLADEGGCIKVFSGTVSHWCWCLKCSFFSFRLGSIQLFCIQWVEAGTHLQTMGYSRATPVKASVVPVSLPFFSSSQLNVVTVNLSTLGTVSDTCPQCYFTIRACTVCTKQLQCRSKSLLLLHSCF